MYKSEEQNMENTNYTLDQAFDFVLADDGKFEELELNMESFRI